MMIPRKGIQIRESKPIFITIEIIFFFVNIAPAFIRDGRAR